MNKDGQVYSDAPSLISAADAERLRAAEAEQASLLTEELRNRLLAAEEKAFIYGKGKTA